MNKLFLLIGLGINSILVFAQALDVEGERSQIRAARVQQEANYQIAESACYARFAVTGCLHEVRARRREALDDLRRQERLLNDVERKRRAQEKIDQISQKSVRQNEQEAAAPPVIGNGQ